MKSLQCKTKTSLLIISTLIIGTLATFADDKKASALNELQMKSADSETQGDLKALKTEMLIATSEKRAIAQVRKLMKRYRGTSMEPGLHLRLAELHMRRSKTSRFFEIHKENNTVLRFSPDKARKASSKKDIKKAIATYDMIERRFPRFSKIDLVIFNNAFARQQLGQVITAEEKYWKLISKHPYSPLVPDGHLAIGEMNFDRKKFAKALEHFNAIKKYPKARVFPYGLYKAGWSYYNLNKAFDGIKELEQVVAYGRYVVENNIDARLDLRKEALADMTIFFEDVYPAKEALKYFQKQAGDLDIAPTILRLAGLYKRHSRYRDKEIVLTDFLGRLPAHAVIPEVHDEMIWNYDSMKNRPASVKQMEKLAKLCEPNSRWLSKQEVLETAQSSCANYLQGTSLKLATKWLRIWKNNKAHEIFANVAESAFEIYLRRSDESKESHQARYVYAELLFQRNKFRVASEQYEIVGLKTKIESLRHDSQYAALLSFEKAVGEKWNSKDEERFRKLAKAYIESSPSGKYRLDIEFKLGLIDYEKGRYESAGTIFARLGETYKKTDKGIKAQDLYLDILNISKNYEALKTYSMKLMAGGAGNVRKEKLVKIYEQSYFLQIQSTEEKKNYNEAIVQYKTFAKANPQSPLAQKAWWNAVQLHYKVFDFWGGAEAAVAYHKRFPKAAESVNGLLKAAQTYESIGELRRAADVLTTLVKADSTSAAKWKALSADFYALNGQTKKAIKLYKDLRKSANADTSFNALEKLLLIEEKRGPGLNVDKLLVLMVETGRQPQAGEAQLKLLEPIFIAKKYPEAFTEAMKLQSIKDVSGPVKARARFIQASILDHEYRTQSMKSQVERVHLVLSLKTNKLDKAQRAYQAAMKFGDPKITVDSLERLADLYADFSRSVSNMPDPEGISPEEVTVFRQELQSLAIPMEEKAVSTMAEAAHQASKFELFDGTAEMLQKRLDALNMLPEREPLVVLETPAIIIPRDVGAVGS